MAKAVSLKDIKSKAASGELFEKGNSSVDFHIYGAGGFGTDAVFRYLGDGEEKASRITVMDTSEANIAKHANRDLVTFLKIDNVTGEGSGKFRPENVEPILNFVSNYTKKTKFHDVNVIVFSMAGGSGSVIGPLLAKEIFRQGKIAILIIVADHESHQDAKNTINTLKGLNDFALEESFYVPTILFDNSFDWSVVNNGVNETLNSIRLMMELNTDAIDMKDKLHFLQPNKIEHLVVPGLRMLNISRDEDGEWAKNLGIVIGDKTEKVDSTMIISSPDLHLDMEIGRSVV